MENNSKNKLALIAIIGKPNVGKSSLFNRLVNQNIAITSEIAGTTRDRLYRKINLNSLDAVLIDTAGLEFEEETEIEKNTRNQANSALEEADLIYFVVDGKAEPLQDDIEIANMLRKKNKKIILIANKCDNIKNVYNANEWLKLGFENFVAISVIHNQNITELVKVSEEVLIQSGFVKSIQEPGFSTSDIKISFVGRPNAGKSSLINAILGKERLVVSDIPGTTRDSIDSDFSIENQNFTLIDTAGIRRRGKIEKGIEKYSIFRTLRAIERSDIVCLVMDYKVGIRAQDLHICEYALESHKGLILIVNKYDLMEDKESEKNRIFNVLKYRFDFLSWAPVIFTSAKNKKNLEVIFEQAISIQQERNKELDHETLKSWLTETYHNHKPPQIGRNRVNFYDIIQYGTNPPSFDIFADNKDNIHFSYKRYIENKFRENFGFAGTSIVFFFKNLDPKTLRDTKPL